MTVLVFFTSYLQSTRAVGHLSSPADMMRNYAAGPHAAYFSSPVSLALRLRVGDFTSSPVGEFVLCSGVESFDMCIGIIM